MHARFICVKVDYKELPSIDAICMNVNITLTRQGRLADDVDSDALLPTVCLRHLLSESCFVQILSVISDAWQDLCANLEEESGHIHIDGELRSMAWRHLRRTRRRVCSVKR
ncbi:DUF255 domain-containing protein [Mycobacterium lepromatosis]|uniref:DUF255 domain-containing protein n=1 Tax=Mycobacterium lepromatosis TaxID=480418 RepID=UPI0006792E92|nr:DUF255 domain-containing protein [Mycobacterium lepromatosis]